MCETIRPTPGTAIMKQGQEIPTFT
jgi:hypothetical protein